MQPAKDTILIVEDDLGVATLERRRLERDGYAVVCATTAKEALGCVEQGGVKLVLLDQGLPDATGLEFYERLKASGYDLPVIMVTGLSDEATVVEALRAGVRDFVTKSPEYLNYLPKAVERVVAQARLEQRLEESEEKYHSIFENAMEGIYQASLDGRLLTANPAMARIFGYGSPEEMICAVSDATTQLWVSAEERARYVRQLQEEGDIAGLETRMKRKDGSMTWVSANMRPLRNSDGDMVGLEGTLEDISEHKRAEERLRYQAFHDSLTGLPNRLLFVDRLEHALARSQRRENEIAVLFLDLDKFKVINDSLGHEAGDRLLVAVCKRLQASLRPEDTIARFGGDEFAILLEAAASLSDVVRVADRISEELERPFVLSEREVVIAASIGIALAASSRERPEELLRNADVAMYRAKGSENGSYQVFDQSMHDQALKRLELENDLRQAVEREEFTVYYQPKVLLETGKVYGFEALVRWKHPRRGLISPAEFISLAEETRLIVPIGGWVLKEACRQVKEWQGQYQTSDAPLMMSVNLSPRQFHQPGLVESIAQVLRETGLDPCSLGVEITESIMSQNRQDVRATLQELKDLGVQVGVDDFGTGYSSLSRLKDLPIDILKIDRSFVSGLKEGVRDEHIVSSILGLASGLGLGVVAEGIETPEQAAQLRTLGCERAQGYYFSKPLPREAVDTLLASYVHKRTRNHPAANTVGDSRFESLTSSVSRK
jgi:diguanylate cyclase (GGDEF)-like protein/PAS domain S-box-containing protein